MFSYEGIAKLGPPSLNPHNLMFGPLYAIYA
jgi:hypothetical protein